MGEEELRKNAFICALLAALAMQCSVSVAKSPRVYTPKGPWAMEYAKDACRLIRNFVDGEDQITLAFERFEVGPMIRLGLAGTDLYVSNNVTAAGFHYLPGGKPRKSLFMQTELADGRQSSLIAEASVLSPESWQKLFERGNKDGRALEALYSEEDLAAAQHRAIVIDHGFKEDMEIRTGSMAEPIKALRACAEDLVKGWGIDPAAFYGMTRPAMPLTRPDRWLSRSDYPRDALRDKQGGLVRLHLVVDVNGNVEGCHFQIEGGSDFEKAACEGITTRAKFKPALDFRGQPMKSIWRQSVRFIP